MRAVLAALLVALASPALTDSWGHYVNVRFGYAIDIPPGFDGRGEADNGDGQVFSTPTAQLQVFGSSMVEGRFEDDVAARQGASRDAGWAITYQATTPNWASYSATQGARVLYARLIPLCGETIGVFELTYGTSDLQRFNPVVDRLVQSLKPTNGSAACPAD